MRRKRLLGCGLMAILLGAGWAAAPFVFGQETGERPRSPEAPGTRPNPAAGAPNLPVLIYEQGNQLAVTHFGAGHDDPEWAKLAGEEAEAARKADDLAHQYGEADDDKSRDDLKSKLAAALEKQFEAQQKLRELEISRIEARVRKLRELLGRRNDARRTIIDKRLDQLVREAEGLGWNSGAAASQGYHNYVRATVTAPIVEPSPARR